MRSPLLNNFFIPTQDIRGIGDRLAPLITKLCGPLSKDIIFTIPRKVNDRRVLTDIKLLQIGQVNTIRGVITQYIPNMKPHHPFKVTMNFMGLNVLTIALFNSRAEWVKRQFPMGAEMIVSGRVDTFLHDYTMPNPEMAILASEAFKLPAIEPVYWLTSGLSPRILYRTVQNLCESLPPLPEWHPQSIIDGEKFPAFTESILRCHNPQHLNDAEPDTPHRRRLAFDELSAHNFVLRRFRQTHSARQNGRTIVNDDSLWGKICQNIPFALTDDQRAVMAEIAGDFAGPNRMTRLLQGDVGSGKTIVALYAMAKVVEYGGQAVLMAPTEILVNQHLETITKFCANCGVNIISLTGKDKVKERREKYQQITDGTAHIIIGTHALFSESLEYKNLLLTVIDEQHRFGVRQRADLYSKGERPDFLIMSATPIPRSLTMAIYGDLSVSRLVEKPKNRQPIKTSVLSVEKMPQLCESLKNQIHNGEKAFWVCPLIEDSETLTQASVDKRLKELTHIFPKEWLGYVHGRLSSEEKNAIMAEFVAGRVKILLATTVIEVGVDVPSANIMIIDGAERFGLAQLHQLRGRVGRGDAPAQCVLLYNPPIGEKMQNRLNIIRSNDNGFIIAEEDLKMRGAGDILGTKQSGLPDFKFVDFTAHGDIMVKARQRAELLLHEDPQLTSPMGQNFQILLDLFK